MGALRPLALALATAGFFLGGLLAPPLGHAAGSCPHRFGAAQQLADAGGSQEWTVTGLKKSAAVLPGYAPAGQLWEASATVRAERGTITPLIPNLAAHAMGGHYPVLWQVATDQGLPATTLAEGQSSSGTIYFDVTGPDPVAVVYTVGAGAPAMMWCCEAAMGTSANTAMDPAMKAKMQANMKAMKADCPCCKDLPAAAPGSGRSALHVDVHGAVQQLRAHPVSAFGTVGIHHLRMGPPILGSALAYRGHGAQLQRLAPAAVDDDLVALALQRHDDLQRIGGSRSRPGATGPGHSRRSNSGHDSGPGAAKKTFVAHENSLRWGAARRRQELSKDTRKPMPRGHNGQTSAGVSSAPNNAELM